MSLIVKSKVKELALAVAAARFKNIPGYSMERVSSEFTDRMEAELRSLAVRKFDKALDKAIEELDGDFHKIVTSAVQTLPAQGKTIR